MPGKPKYDVSERIPMWCEIREMNLNEARCKLHVTYKLFKQWLEGRLVPIETLLRMANVFGTTPMKFLGHNIAPYEERPCGRKKVLEILGRDGNGDYLNNDDVISLNQNLSHRTDVVWLGSRSRHLTDLSDKTSGGY